jgi:hypothetical protein
VADRPPERLGAALRRADPLAWGGLAAAAVLVAFPAYYAFASLVPLFGGSEGHAGDFVYYFRAGLRFRVDPATLYDEENFLYPPPTGVLFAAASWLPIAWGYVVFGAFTVAALAVCLRLVEALLPERPAGWARAAWWAIGLASAPALQNVKFGQVNVYVLLAALVFVRAVSAPEARARALALGGAALALGAWLKLYPIVLAVFALRRRTWPALAGLAAGLVAVPVVVSGAVPPSLYQTFVVDVLGGLSRAATAAALNAGLPAAVERLRLPPGALALYRPAALGAAAEATAFVVLAGGIAATALAWARGWPAGPAAFAALAVLPVASTLGWEYTFVLALPAFLMLLVAARNGPPAVRLVGVVSVGAWLVQKPPEGVVRWAVVALPEVLAEAFPVRFVAALAALAACALWTSARGRSTRAGPSSSPP